MAAAGKDLMVSYLLDFYGPMLTDPQREMVEAYYNADLSLGEIAAQRGISRQGVRDAVVRASQQLYEMEKRLGLAQRFRTIDRELTAICDCALNIQDLDESGGPVEGISENAAEILRRAKVIAEAE